jgi:hypothetical protein
MVIKPSLRPPITLSTVNVSLPGHAILPSRPITNTGIIFPALLSIDPLKPREANFLCFFPEVWKFRVLEGISAFGAPFAYLGNMDPPSSLVARVF